MRAPVRAHSHELELVAVEVTRDLNLLASHNDDLLARQKLLGHSRGQAACSGDDASENKAQHRGGVVWCEVVTDDCGVR